MDIATPQELIPLMQELIETQKKKLLACANEIIPYVTSDDIMQPNDFPELENHAFFRYEEGVLEGLQSAEAAIRLWLRSYE